jgi:hypothetical protein
MDEFVKEVFWNVKDLVKYELFYDSGISKNEHFHSTYELVKNLSYSTQYLEFIDNSLNYEIHSVLRVELTKSFVIVGIGIVESILYDFIKTNNLHRINEYKEVAIFKANEKKVDNDIIRIETRLLKTLENPIEEEMNLDSMLKKAEQNKLIGEDDSLYKQLNRLRKLRNKVHLHLIEEHLDTDWNNFKQNELIMIKKTLLKLIHSDIFNYDTQKKHELFNFLK